MSEALHTLRERFGPACVELAMLACPASRVEPGLLASLRRRLAPHLGADSEGALWFSGLVEACGVDGVVLAMGYRRRLWKPLLLDPRAEAAWGLIAARHPCLSPALRVEELVNWHANRLEHLPLSREEREHETTRLEQALEPVLKAVHAGESRAPRLARWLQRAWPEFHERAQALPVMNALTRLLNLRGQGVPARGGVLNRDFLGRYGSLFDSGPRRLVSVRLTGEELVLGGSADSGGRCLEVPDTTPCEVSVEWGSGDHVQRELVVLDPRRETRLKVEPGPIRIITLDGAVFDPSVEAAAEGSPPEEFLGAWPVRGGTHFRFWFPSAHRVAVLVAPSVPAGTDAKSETRSADREVQLSPASAGVWSGFLPDTDVGDRYAYRVGLPARTEASTRSELILVDPCARAVSDAGEWGIITRRVRQRAADGFRPVPPEELVLYELHLGSFAADPLQPHGGFDAAARQLSNVRALGVNGILLMPVHTCGAPNSWGFDPVHLYAVAARYGGPDAFKRFVRKAHAHDLAVILNVCLSHASPQTSLRRFEVAPQDNERSVYLASEPEVPPARWGPRYNTTHPEVARYLRENALAWLAEYGVDGMQWDELSELMAVGGLSSAGARFVRETNHRIRAQFPHALVLAEDDPASGRGPDDLRALGVDGSFAFGFCQEVRRFLIQPWDEARDVHSLAQTLLPQSQGGARRLLYLESHNEAGDARPRLPTEIDSGDPESRYAWKRSLLGAVFLLTTDGLPMLFQGQEFLEHRPFLSRPEPLDWSRRAHNAGFVRAITDLVRLRVNREGDTRGLTGSGTTILWEDEQNKVIAYHRFHPEATADSGVLVVVNGANRHHDRYALRFPSPGRWAARFRSENSDYRLDAEGPSADIVLARASGSDPPRGEVRLAPYSALIFIRTGDEPPDEPADHATAGATAQAQDASAIAEGQTQAGTSAPPKSHRVELLLTGPDGKSTELPFIIGVVADLAGRPRESLTPVAERRFANVESPSLGFLFALTPPRLAFRVPALTIEEEKQLGVELEFGELDDFLPERVARQFPVTGAWIKQREALVGLLEALPDRDRTMRVLKSLGTEGLEAELLNSVNAWIHSSASAKRPSSGAARAALSKSIEAAVARLDERLSRLVDVVIHHPDFLRLEGTWRGLARLVSQTDSFPNVKVQVLHLSKTELIELFGGSESGASASGPGDNPIARRLDDGLETVGGEPLACVVGDYQFNHSPEDLAVLEGLARICAAAHAPFLSAASSKLLGLKSWPDLARVSPRRLELESREDYARWRALRRLPEANALALTMPRMLARLPYGRATSPARGFAYEEAIDPAADETWPGPPQNLVWTNAAYALATNLARSHVETGLCLRIRGQFGGGQVDGLPLQVSADEPAGVSRQSPTEVLISDQLEQELAEVGLIPLQYLHHTGTAVFRSANTLRQPEFHEHPKAAETAALAARLPYVLLGNRFAQYLRLMTNQHVGRNVSSEQVEAELNRWLQEYCSAPDAPAEVQQARPLVEARVELGGVGDQVGYYVAHVRLRPHDQRVALHVEIGRGSIARPERP